MITQTQIEANLVTEVALLPCVGRTLSYYLDCGSYFRSQKEALTEVIEATKEAKKQAREAWNKYLKHSGQASFIKHCLMMLKKWEALSKSLQDELMALPLPRDLSCTAAVDLMKVPVDAFSQCLTRLRDHGELRNKDVTAIAKLFHFKKKSHLIPEMVMSNDDWGAKKYKLNPEQLAVIQEKVPTQAVDETVKSDHLVDARKELEDDESLILPNPKKQYIRDVIARVEEPHQSKRSKNLERSPSSMRCGNRAS